MKTKQIWNKKIFIFEIDIDINFAEMLVRLLKLEFETIELIWNEKKTE